MEHDAINDSVDNSISRSKNMNVGLKKIINAIKCFDFDISSTLTQPKLVNTL